MSIQQSLFQNYFMTSCHINDANDLLFVAEEPQEIPDPFWARNMKYIAFHGEDYADENRWSIVGTPNINKVYVGWVTKPEPYWVMTSMPAYTQYGPAPLQKGGFIKEQQIPPRQGEMYNIINNTNVIAGKMYAVSGSRYVARRDAPNNWTVLQNGLPDYRTNKEQAGFQTIDGFAEDDLYAGGMNGDLWHWAGQSWEQLEMPTNAWLLSVCCGGDGLVYISTDRDTLIIGKGDHWEVINTTLSGVIFRTMKWFKDRLLMPYGGTLYEVNNGKFQPSEYNDIKKYPNRPVDWSCMDTNGEYLLAGSKLEVALFDGNTFETVIPYDSSPYKKSKNTEK